MPYLTTYVSGPEICVVSPLMAFGSCRNLIENHFTEGQFELIQIHICLKIKKTFCIDCHADFEKTYKDADPVRLVLFAKYFNVMYPESSIHFCLQLVTLNLLFDMKLFF